MYVYDMHTVWERLKGRVRIEVRPEEALLIIKKEFPFPPSILWDYLTRPDLRTIVLGASKVEMRNQKQGRTMIDSAYYCYHGNMQSQQLILDWSPFEQFSTDDSSESFGVTTRITYKLEPTQNGTRAITFFGKPRGPRLRVAFFALLARFVFAPSIGKSMDQLRERIQQDLANGTAFISPPIDVDKVQLASLTTQTLTHDH